MMAQGQNVLLDIDTVGAINVMENTDDYVSIFILPPSYTELRKRLEGRGTDSAEVIDRRMNNARGEIAKVNRYQYSIVNDDLETAYQQLKEIIEAEKQRTNRCEYTIPE